MGSILWHNLQMKCLIFEGTKKDHIFSQSSLGRELEEEVLGMIGALDEMRCL